MKKRSFLALLLALAVFLCGCGETAQPSISVEEAPSATVVPAAYDPYEEVDPDADGAAENYTAENQVYYNGNVMPAPETVLDTSKQTEDEAEDTQSETDTSYSEDAWQDAGASSLNMGSGDITMGVVVGTDADINPLSTSYRDFLNIDALVYESLVDLDENLQPQPMLADRWSYDGEIWTFTLRSGIIFHDGTPLTAQDVVSSYLEILNHPSSKWYDLVSAISGMQAVDDLTLEVKTNSSLGIMVLYAMTFPVVPQNSVQDETPPGTGPYWFISYSKNKALRLESNPLWWRRATDSVESVVAIFYSSTSQALEALETGEIDTLATESATASLSRSLNDRVTSEYSTGTYECLIPNMDGDILSSINVRQAIMYAIDRTTLAETVYSGMVQQSEVPIRPGSYLYDAQSAMYNYSPERALSLLYQDGWSDDDSDGILSKEMNGSIVQLEITLVTYERGTTTTRSRAAELIAEQLGKVGFSVTVETISTSDTISTLRNGKFDLALVAFEMSDLPNLAFMLSAGAKCNYSRYESASMDTLLKEAYAATDEDTLKSTMSKIQLKIVEELPIMGLFFRTGLVICKKSLGSLSGGRQGNVLRGLATATMQ